LADAAVTCRALTKSYVTPSGEVVALRPVDVSVPLGTIAAVVGPSGCGKSTLLRLLTALELPTAGELDVGGVDVTALHRRRLRDYRRTAVTYLAQRAAANLIPHLSLAQQLGRRAELAEALGVAHRLGARADQLSGGEQARGALAVALGRDTPLLVIDEPTAELDRGSAAAVLTVLEEAAARGRAIVVATHDRDVVGVAATTLDLAPLHAAEQVASAGAPRAPAAPEAPAVDVRDLTKRYGDAYALDGATLALGRGELGVVLGRSGSGKSTLLMALGGWLSADSGTITIAGETATRNPPWSRVSYLAQRFALLPELTVAENVGLPLRLAGEASPQEVDALLERLALGSLRDRTPAQISVGQQQRVAVARALVRRPDVVLADEPTSHQDAASAELVWSALADASAQGTACLLVTHDEHAATRASRVWHIADGRVSSF
jgi:ABC-type lipoprotein export system ATPase subunit